MSIEPLVILQRRLAAGEITIEEYRQVLAELGKSGDESKGDAQQRHLGKELARVDTTALYENYILHTGEYFSLGDVVGVRSGRSTQTYNLIPVANESSVVILFRDGTYIDFQESRKIFGGKRHAAIELMAAQIKNRTFRQRIERFISTLKASGRIQLCGRAAGNGQDVFLTIDGSILCDSRKISLKEANSKGTFGIGSNKHSISGLNYEIRPNEVIVSLERGFFSSSIPRNAVRFTSTLEDVDIANSIIEWLAKPGNSLEQKLA